MLSFDYLIKNNNLSGLENRIPPQIKNKAKESILRSLRLKGSVSIEAALVLPLFLFFLMTLLSSLQLLNFSVKLQQLLYQEGIYQSEISYDRGSTSVDRVRRDIEDLLTTSVSEGVIPVEGGVSGLNFSRSDFSDPELTKIGVSYTAKLSFDPFNLFSRTFYQHVIFHNWVGYVHGISGHEHSLDVEYVYITEDSEVYHRNRECTHIRLNIEEVSSSQVGNMRNENGERYTSCRHCRASLSDSRLYITREGNCYHNSLSCSGLSRTVRAIPLSEIGSRRPCSRCGY